MKKALLPIGVLMLSILILLPLNLHKPVLRLEQKIEKENKFKSEIKIASEHKNAVKNPKFDSPNKYAELFAMLKTKEGEKSPRIKENYIMNEFNKAKRERSKYTSLTAELNWEERGPANVGGRTRGIIADPDDASGNTWFVASVGGGIWKTTNAGVNWIHLTEDLPALSTSYLAMAESNHNVIYAGTGEGFGNADGLIGQGIFKTTDKGNSWFQLSSTANSSFYYVNRIVVDPSNENIVVAATNSGLFKSTNGGTSWVAKYSGRNTQHVIANPKNFKTLYCGVNGLGVIKSTNAGETWFETGEFMGYSGRFEIAISPTDTARIYAANQASALLMSPDAGKTWLTLEEEDGSSINWMSDQGWYDNTIEVHPYDENVVFIGGIDNWRSEITVGSVLGITEVQTSENFSTAFVPYNLGLPYLDGGLGTGDNFWKESVFDPANLVEIELRSGSGDSQFAHRFYNATYTYEDYLEIPFEVWDITNNKQLAVSFEDVDKNGSFNYRLTRGDILFVHNVDYNAGAANPEIAQDVSGIKYNNMYVIALRGQTGTTWDPANLPDASLSISLGQVAVAFKNSEPITDGYGQYGVNFGVHVDQHNLVMVPMNESTKSFKIISGNDGGVGISDNGGVTWRETDVNGYNTTQFYGVDKKNGSNEYLGGTQDNGTWQSAPGVDANVSTPYTFRIGGDGFEVAWHYKDPLKMIGGSQFNRLYRTTDGWQTGQAASVGFDDWANSTNSPFISKIADSNIDPDLVFTISRQGVYRSDNFAENWNLIPIPVADLHNNAYFSFAQVEISAADPQVVWAGAYMSSSGGVNVSKDGGLSFKKTTNSYSLGLISGFSTHPTDPATAFATFGITGSPKILKTTNYGSSWTDITGFSGGVSSNGFPDVTVYDVEVMPYNANIIWAGTEIGLFESVNGGQTWYYANNGLPAVAIWEMKIVNDQVILATHGRGIWSVTLPELNGYEPPLATLAPRLNSLTRVLTGISIDVSLRSVYDSTAVKINGSIAKVIHSQNIVDTSFIFESNVYGEINVSVSSYKDGREFKSTTESIMNFSILEPKSGYITNFENTTDDLFLIGLSAETPTGFQNAALHSLHPYIEKENLVAVLRVPIIVAATDATLSYDDIAIVEPGEPGTVFGDDEFWDYVIVEAFKNSEWIPLLDGYDATFNNTWLNAYSSNTSGNSSMFVKHTINLLDFFSPGDTTLIRFRLFSDEAVANWGWAIDNISVQDKYVGVDESRSLPNVFALEQNYPNPFNPTTTIKYSIPSNENVTLKIYDVLGKEVATLVNETKQAGNYQVSFNASNLSSGVYFSRIKFGNQIITKKMLLLK